MISRRRGAAAIGLRFQRDRSFGRGCRCTGGETEGGEIVRVITLKTKPAMHNPRSMIHDLASTAHDSRSAPRSPIRNLPRSINDPRITARRPGTSEFTARSLRHAGIPNITILAPAVPPGSPEFTPDRRGVARMPGIQPDPKPKSPSTSAFDQISMQPLPNSLNTPGFGPLTPKSSRRRCTILDP